MQLLEDSRPVGFDRAGADVEPRADFPAGQTEDDELEDVALAPGKDGEHVACRSALAPLLHLGARERRGQVALAVPHGADRLGEVLEWLVLRGVPERSGVECLRGASRI